MNKLGIGVLSALGIGCIGAGAFCLAENAYSYGKQNAATQKEETGQDVPAKLEDVLATFSGEYPGVVPEIVDVGDDKYVVLMGNSSYCYDDNTGDLTTINVSIPYKFFGRVGGVEYFTKSDAAIFNLLTFNGTNFEEYMHDMSTGIPSQPFYTTDNLMLCYDVSLKVIDLSQKQISTFSMWSAEYVVKNNKMYFVSGQNAVDGSQTINCLDLDNVSVSEGPKCQISHGVDMKFLTQEQDADYFQIVYQRDDVLYRYDGINEIQMLTLSASDSVRYSSAYYISANLGTNFTFYMNDYLIYFTISNIEDEQVTDTLYVYDINKLQLISLASYNNNAGYWGSYNFYNTGVYINMNIDGTMYNAIYDSKFGFIPLDSTSLIFVQSCDNVLFYVVDNGSNRLVCKTESGTSSTNICTMYNSVYGNNSYTSNINVYGNNPIQKIDNKYFWSTGDQIYIVEIENDVMNVYSSSHIRKPLVITPQYVLSTIQSANLNNYLVVFDHTIKDSATESTRIVWQFTGDYEFASIDGNIVKLTSANGSEYELDLDTKVLTCTKLNITVAK